MKLSVSNIAWDLVEDEAVLDLLIQKGVSGIEIAPTKYWPKWQGATPEAAEKIREELHSKGLAVSALQAILFDKPEMLVFGDRVTQQNLLDHLSLVSKIAESFGAKVLVFGSPKNRDPGDLSTKLTMEKGISFFSQAAEICARHNVQLCLEPNPKLYNCNYLTHWQEIYEIVETISHPGLAIHLDTACIELEGDDVIEAINKCEGKISHFHISEENLSDLLQPKLDHAAIGEAIKASNYNNWLSIEMRRSENPLLSIEKSIDLVQKYYL